MHRIVLVIAAVSLSSGRAMADDTKAECVAAFDAAQRARQKSDLIEARKQLRLCSREICPAVVHEPCTEWLREVESAMPSVVLSVRTADGDDIANARVSIDGKPTRLRLSGTPIELSPGEHSVRIEVPGKPEVERKIIVNSGEKNRLVTLTLPPEPEPKSALRSGESRGESTSAPTWPYFVGALGIVAIGGGVTLDVLGSRRLSDHRDDCAPDCNESDVSTTRTMIIVGDSLIAVGVIALGIAAYGLVTGKPVTRTTGAAF
jgi:hypothetical protein